MGRQVIFNIALPALVLVHLAIAIACGGAGSRVSNPPISTEAAQPALTVATATQAASPTRASLHLEEARHAQEDHVSPC